MRLVLPMVGAAVGVAAGLGATTFGYAEGAAYMKNDPKACANCHVMREQYEGWQRSSHRAAATCNDCHAPHATAGKLMTKAQNGFMHSIYFTLGGFHEPIAITPRNRAVTEGQCRHCHEPIVEAIDARSHGGGAGGEPIACLQCHRSVGHLH
jgi:cytochrome c nitrite reductase small subunit